MTRVSITNIVFWTLFIIWTLLVVEGLLGGEQFPGPPRRLVYLLLYPPTCLLSAPSYFENLMND